MKYPWTHDEVPGIPSRPSTGMRLLTLVVWGCLFFDSRWIASFFGWWHDCYRQY